MKLKILLTLTLSIFAFSACRQTATTEKAKPARENAARNEIKQISVGEAKQAVGASDAQFIDVRTTEEFVGGHAPEAANFPLDALEKDSAKLVRDKPVYLICQTGRRSQKGAEILRKAGFTDIYNIEGGTSAWINARLPVEKGEK